MSIGGGFKKGKAEFAMKDVDGNDIKTATESFRYKNGDKILRVGGIDTISSYGIYFRYDANECRIYIDQSGKLSFDGYCYFPYEVTFDDSVYFNGYIYDNSGNYMATDVTSFDKPAYLSCDSGGGVTWSGINDVHCWQFKKGDVTLFIYIADYVGNSATANIFTYFDSPLSEDEFNLRVNKVVYIRGIYNTQNSKKYMVSYDITRGAGTGGSSVNFAVTFIGRDSSGAMDVATFNQEMTSTSYQNAEIKLIF